MTRQIVLDTETTGLEPQEGHRIIEIGCVELVNRKITGNRISSSVATRAPCGGKCAMRSTIRAASKAAISTVLLIVA